MVEKQNSKKEIGQIEVGLLKTHYQTNAVSHSKCTPSRHTWLFPGLSTCCSPPAFILFQALIKSDVTYVHLQQVRGGEKIQKTQRTYTQGPEALTRLIQILNQQSKLHWSL